MEADQSSSGKLKAFLLGLLMVTLVSANTRQVAHLHFAGAFFVGVAISLTWVFGIKAVAHSSRIVGVCYALGAGCGTLLGMVITRYFYGA